MFGIIIGIILLYMVYFVNHARIKKEQKQREEEKQKLRQIQYEHQENERAEIERAKKELRNTSTVVNPSKPRNPTVSKKGIDKTWIDDGNGFAICPQCNKRMTHDYARARGKCPDCGHEYVAIPITTGEKPVVQVESTLHSTQAPVSSSVNSNYIQYIMSSNPTITRDDAVAFSSVLDVYESTGNKIKTLEAFDTFISQLASDNPMHAMMVNGFFCGLLGKNISLTKDEITSLSQKYTPMIITKLNS